MPRKAIDYSNGLVYKLCCKDTTITEIYVGSTTNFTKRKHSHHLNCICPVVKAYNKKAHLFIRENGGWENWNMVLIEYYPCETELELGRRENYWIYELQASLNCRTPPMYGTVKEYYEAHKEEILEYQKQYNEANKERIAERKKEYAEANKEHIAERKKEYAEANKEHIDEYQKQYREANKEELKEYIKEYYEANKEKLLEKHICECGREYTYSHKKRHEKSQYHTEHLEQK